MREESYTDKFEEIFRKAKYKSQLNKIATVYPEKKSLVISFSELEKIDPDLADELLEKPAEIIKEAEEAIRRLKLPIDGDDWNIHFRVSDLPEDRYVWIRNLRSEHIGKLIGVEGVVRTAAEVRPQAVEISFQCPSCGEFTTIPQQTFFLQEPYACGNANCGRKGKFKVSEKKLIDTTSIKIQEPPELIEGSEQPSTLKIELRDDLVSPVEKKKILPGNKVRLIGILKEFPVKGNLNRYEIFLDCIYIETTEQIYEEIELTEKDIKEIKKVASDLDVYNKLIDSIAPSIYGYREIKEAILLQLFGGVPKLQPDGTRIRGDIHLFLIGDPGTGKSQLLRYVAGLAPKGKYVSGKGASAAGLTAAAIRDEVSGSWMLEAGAMVLANMGVAAIDEFEKMSKEDRGVMHEALEQQTVSIAKAGIVTSLNAKTSVLAAANPKYGRFDSYRPLAEQIELGPAILSRFDLKFPVQDLPTREKDEALAEHILKSYTHPETIEPVFKPSFLRKYIAYAKKNIFPKLTKEAQKLLKDFYVEWRTRYSGEEGTVSLTPRQLEALSRLAEASARIRLDKSVRAEDVQRATRLLEFSLRQLGTDQETGKIDIDRIDVGITSAQRSKIHVVWDILKGLEETHGKRIPEDEIYRAGEERGFTKIEIEDIIEKLKQKGDLFSPRPGYLQKA